MYLQAIGDERLPVTLGINVKGMLGIASRDLASRYEKHIAICAHRLEEVLSQECNELAAQAKLYPDAFNSTHNIPEIREKLIPSDSNFSDLPRAAGAAGTVEEPSFPDGLSGYNYVLLTHQIPLQDSGEYVVTIDGIKCKIEFSS
jgi:hypothetical protein